MGDDLEIRLRTVARVVEAMRRYWQKTGRRKTLPIRQVLYDVWENRTHGPRSLARSDWTPEARQIFQDSRKRGDVIYDHAVPMTMVVDKLFETNLNDPDAVQATLDRYVVVRIISKREDAILRDAGLNDQMPASYWDETSPLFGDPLARYLAAGIDLGTEENKDEPIETPRKTSEADAANTQDTGPFHNRTVKAGLSADRPGTDFGFKPGSFRARLAPFYARPDGATHAEVVAAFGDVPWFNLLTAAEDRGHDVIRTPEVDPISRVVTTRYHLVHRDDR